MERFIEGEQRSQVTLLPECLDDHISEDNPIRVVDVFVDGLRLHELGYRRQQAQGGQQPRQELHRAQAASAHGAARGHGIKRYLVELDRADRDPSAVLPSWVDHLQEKIAKVKQQMHALGEIGEQMKACEDRQISRSIATSGRGIPASSATTCRSRWTPGAT